MTGLSIRVPIFFSCSLCHFSNWSGVYSASTSPSLCFPFPSFTFPSHASSHSEMVLSVPQPVSMPPPYYSFRCFYQSHLLYLRWFSSFFPIPCSINLISIFLVQPVLQSLFLHANFIPPPTYFLLAHLTQQSPSPFLTAFRLFFLPFLHLNTCSFCPFALFHIVTSACLPPQQILPLIFVKGSYFWYWCPAEASLLEERK